MEILHWELAKTLPLSAEDIKEQRVLIITDWDIIEAEALQKGIVVLRTDNSEKNDFISSLNKSGTDCDIIIVTMKPQPVSKLSQYTWRSFSWLSLALLQWCISQKRPIHLLCFHSSEDVLASIFSGLARSVSLEAPLISFTCTEIAEPSAIELNSWIKNSLSRPGARLYYNGSQLSQWKLAPEAFQSTSRPVLQAGDNVIVIGGAGGIGIELCTFLRDQVQDQLLNVFVLGRKTPDRECLDKLKECGVKNYFKVDATDPQALGAVCNHISENAGSIKAIFNLAGVLDDCLFFNLTEDRLEKVLCAKADVVLNLASLPLNIRPEFTVNFSSLTATIGNIGQSAYAAANEFVERVTQQIPGGFSFSWGLWQSQGMQMEHQTSGLEPLEPNIACQQMFKALENNQRHQIIFEGHLAEIDALISRSTSMALTVEQENSSTMSTEIFDKETLETLTCRWLSEIILRHSGLKIINPDDNLLNKGLDSVSSIQISTDIITQLETIGDIKISRAILFECPTITQLTKHMLECAEPLLQALLRADAQKKNTSTLQEQILSKDTSEVNILKVKPSKTEPLGPLPGNWRENDIAIIGLAGEFPGGNSLETFWQSLLNGEDSVTVIPDHRWNWRTDYNPKLTAGKTYGRHGGFISDAWEFDPVFFNITPSDAQLMDPQERRFLQASYHALEDAGYFINPIREVGVFSAAMFGHYQDLSSKERVISSSFASIANRVSYSFDLHGPSLTLDTMCSGSLSALHMACNSLQLGECKVALAGGSNIMTHPGKYRLLAEGKFLSPTGHCHAFGIEADGYVPGEGVAAVVLKPLAAAIADNDVIYAVVRATAVNSGGKTSGFTVPSAHSQYQVIRAALDKAEVDPSDINYIEAHGTGTSLGDPIELEALQKAYNSINEDVCYLGSVKSNIGHLESAAGMASLFKVVLQLHHQQLVPTLHCAIENPHLNIDQTRFKLVKKSQSWPLASSETRFAGISSFGAGGTNGHVILQQYIAHNEPICSPEQDEYLIPLSAPNKSGLKRVIKQMRDYLSEKEDIDLYALSYSLCCTKQHHSERICWVIRNKEQLIASLYDNGTPDLRSISGYHHNALSYMQGKTVNFNDLFPFKKRLRLPPYPFAKKIYQAEGFQTNAFIPSDSAGSGLIRNEDLLTKVTSPVLLEPVWRLAGITSWKNSTEWIVVMTSPQQKLPIYIDGMKVLHVTHGDKLTITGEKIILRTDVKEDFDQALSYLSQKLNLAQIHWVNFNVHWTYLGALALAKAIQSQSLKCNLLCLNDCLQAAEDIAMAGVFRTLALENDFITFAQTWSVSPLDLTKTSNSSLVTQAISLASKHGIELKWQNKQLWQRDLSPLKLESKVRLKKEGVYLIAGGLGMIGKAIAQRLYEHYQAKVVLIGRSTPSEHDQAWLKQFSGNNKLNAGEIVYMRSDITSRTEMEHVLDKIIFRFNKLNGVIQSAGIIKDSLVQNKSLADFESVMAVKVQGTRELDRCTADLDLDFFCLFSSISSVMGNAGQCDYVAANRFLDEFSVQRNKKVSEGIRSGHTLSINWPLWLDLEEDANPREQYRALADYLYHEFGLRPLSSNQGAEMFDNWINGIPENCSQMIGLLGKDDVIISRFTRPESKNVPRTSNSSHKRTDGKTISIEELRIELIALTQELTQLEQEDISLQKSWGDLGMNSVMLQIMAQRISKQFGIPVPPNAMFNYGSIATMAEFLAQQGAGLITAETTLPISTYEEKPLSLHQINNPAEEGFAIIGISGIMPGATNVEAYWELLRQNRSAVDRVNRWKPNDHSYHAAVIDNIEQFDARFFGLSAREAMLMDPQHRLFLQTSYNALLDAGYAPNSLTDVGVFAGVQFTDYQTLLQAQGKNSHPYAATGNAHAMLANRVSYLLNFNGPSQTIDTACSSSIVAINRGIMSLRNNECSLALVGAVSLLIDSAISDAANSMGVLSPNFRCATFDESANGYVRGEGVGCVVIKRLKEARRDGDSIYGVIESISENHGGRSNSLTAPNPQAQASLIRKAYSKELAECVSYIETHGTGTRLGDPIEIDALKQAFNDIAPSRHGNDIALGAVKTNIGHLEPAAGIASLLKVLLCFKHRYLPANINFQKQNPLIDLSNSPFYLLTENQIWNPVGKRIAGISCFGFGGSNTHVVLSEDTTPKFVKRNGRPCWLITMSAKSAVSLAAMCHQLKVWLETSEDELADIAFTLALGRENYAWRASWIAESVADLHAQIISTDRIPIIKCKQTEDIWTPSAGSQNTDYEWCELMSQTQREFHQGKVIDWKILFGKERFLRLNMPGYVFDTNAYWFEQEADKEFKENMHGN
ncbi:SDR family NAD(P)-dependent oxidoreductase [Xenorhabdus sp. KJ12.1]|uniref:SDR family NAD(P)-dependent oxidoreductase n=1 Tax=Xenorhabdus sp. KJ12.1 TaxID=1851571 RepID=UPI000C0573F2|nr:SDR family NAD(P)-dependent oxidoreductase [Xenorhabdus sp. KJ12.1]PHM67143.1 tylactone synthase modules 4 & 5 [Xenorhabdus sp. KJ12.1]